MERSVLTADAVYRSRSSLWRHMQAVHEGLRYNCDQCEYKAIRQSSLTSHIQAVHEGVRYKCDQCEYSVKPECAGHLNRHKKTVHDKVKDYKCHRCEYAVL